MCGRFLNRWTPCWAVWTFFSPCGRLVEVYGRFLNRWTPRWTGWTLFPHVDALLKCTDAFSTHGRFSQIHGRFFNMWTLFWSVWTFFNTRTPHSWWGYCHTIECGCIFNARTPYNKHLHLFKVRNIKRKKNDSALRALSVFSFFFRAYFSAEKVD